MKTLTLWTIILTLFSSCSNDYENIVPAKSVDNLSTATNYRKTGITPNNTANAYDYAGQLYYDICDSYLTEGNATVTTAETITKIENIANKYSEFQAQRPATYASPTALRIDDILSNQQLTAINIISNSSLSAKAKISLTGFLTSLMLYNDLKADYEDVHQFIVGYEATILNDVLTNSNDKKLILTTASISRYVFYFAKKHKRKPKDRDWEISWGHIVAGFDGSEDNTAKGIIMSSVCSIVDNK